MKSSYLYYLHEAQSAGIHFIVSLLNANKYNLPASVNRGFNGRVTFYAGSPSFSKFAIKSSKAVNLSQGFCLSNQNGRSEIKTNLTEIEDVRRLSGIFENYSKKDEFYLFPEYKQYILYLDDSIGGLKDSLFKEAARHIVESGIGSTSNIQRKFNIGYNRAGRLMEQLEASGIVGPQLGSKPRQILVDIFELERILALQ